ncbi:hypothetical protein [Mycoplasma zalophi]|uniref:hypothetical protein n=1 Tax=Mycoplasma zalophi TaxID=191287 RepID=UPI001C10CCD5|nr:hypothetical protein [Mycoplasma zalophi]MBU4690834.1 hypothetical protein [Mycoplasma zalophi]
MTIKNHIIYQYQEYKVSTKLYKFSFWSLILYILFLIFLILFASCIFVGYNFKNPASITILTISSILYISAYILQILSLFKINNSKLKKYQKQTLKLFLGLGLVFFVIAILGLVYVLKYKKEYIHQNKDLILAKISQDDSLKLTPKQINKENKHNSTYQLHEVDSILNGFVYKDKLTRFIENLSLKHPDISKKDLEAKVAEFTRNYNLENNTGFE